MNVNKIIDKALANVDSDRKKATELLNDVAKFLGKDQTRYREAGLVAAKYLETLQRSNEQLVKISALLSRSVPIETEELSDEEADSLYDEIEDDGEG